MKHLLVKLLLSSILIISCIGQTVFAKTDDAGVLAGLESNSDMYSYLNYYHYSLWLADHRYSSHDMYISADQSVIISLWDYSTPPSMIYITKSGYVTNKGAMVGMTRSEVESLYGPLLEDTEWGRPAEPYGDIYPGYDTYTGYYVGEYVGYHNEGLSFVFNKYTDQVVLIRYQRDRHGNSNVLSDVKEYNLLPYLL